MTNGYHIPVLLKEAVDGLAIKKGGRYVDVTFGGGGHSQEILTHLEGGELIAFDRDPEAKQNLIADERLTLVPSDFLFIEEVLEMKGKVEVDGILADLGISSHQIDTPERGFSHRFDGPMDMRMNPSEGQTAADILNAWEMRELVHLFRIYGEVPNASKLARIITERRESEEIRNTQQFEAMIQSCIPPKRRAKYLSQVYQALRIEVNGELASLEKLLQAAVRLLKPGGRLVVIAYHSLEDRMVKRYLRSGNPSGKVETDIYGRPLSPWKLIVRRAIQPSEEEIEANPRARSARLRIAERALLENK
ncbi:MAG: 16S rRNA (cytosine(1402)-N(4))-methyltransferase RsmH [Bacteroidota bacterium]